MIPVNQVMHLILFELSVAMEPLFCKCKGQDSEVMLPRPIGLKSLVRELPAGFPPWQDKLNGHRFQAKKKGPEALWSLKCPSSQAITEYHSRWSTNW